MCLFCWTQRKIFWRMWETEQFWGTIDFHSILFPTMEVNGAPKQPGYKLSSKYLPLCSAEKRNSYRFVTTWGWVNDDTIFIFGWTIPLNLHEANNRPSSVLPWWPKPTAIKTKHWLLIQTLWNQACGRAVILHRCDVQQWKHRDLVSEHTWWFWPVWRTEPDPRQQHRWNTASGHTLKSTSKWTQHLKCAAYGTRCWDNGQKHLSYMCVHSNI